MKIMAPGELIMQREPYSTGIERFLRLFFKACRLVFESESQRV